MDYTTVPRSLIYRDRRSLEEFGVYDEGNIMAPIADTMLHMVIIRHFDSENRTLWCMNTAFYICTMILLEKDPRWRISNYVSIATPSWSYSQLDFRKLTLSLVVLLLARLENPLRDTHPYGERVRNDLRSLLIKNEMYDELEYKITLGASIRYIIPNNTFAPRVIDKETVQEALSASSFNWPYFLNYFEERSVRDVVKAFGSTEEEKHNVVNMLRQASDSFYTAEYNDYPETVNNIFDDIDKEISLEFNPNAEQEITEEDRTELITPIDLAPYDAQIKELKEENTDLKNTIAELQQPVEEMPAVQKVRMELVFQLLKKAGLTDDVLQQQNNKQKVATIMSILLDIHNKNKKGNEAQTCATYLSARDLSRSRHEETINKINALLKELNIDVQI